MQATPVGHMFDVLGGNRCGMQGGRPRVAFACAAALAMVLEGHPEGCQAVHQLGGLPPLMRMLSHGGAQAKRAAAEVLQALAAEHLPLKKEIAAAGAVPLLVSLLRQGEPLFLKPSFWLFGPSSLQRASPPLTPRGAM